MSGLSNNFDGGTSGGGDATNAEQQTQTAILTTIDTDTGNIDTKLGVIDDWDESDRAKVNPIVGQAGIAAGTGVDGVTVPRVTLATNVPLPAGTNNIGDVDVLTLPALPAGTNNIGDVDVLTVNGVAPSFGTGVRDAGTQRVTIATNDAVPVTDNSSSLSVDWNGTQPVTGSGNATGALRVELPTNGTGTLATVSTVSTVSALGISTTGPQKAEDVAHANGDMGIAVWGVSNEANTARAADGDYLPFATDTEGNSRMVGNRDHDAVDAGEVVKVGGQARTTNPTAVADADRAHFITDKLGKQVVVGCVRDLKGNQATTITSSTSETTIVTAVASTFLDLYGLVITNTSATACNVTIKDSTAGTTRFVFAVPAGDTRGFMLNESAAHKQATVNTNWTATCSASVASIEITALFVSNI